MALGGGVWVTQNKVLPGTYINFDNRTTTSATMGERGVVAIALALGTTSSAKAGTVVECTVTDFLQNQETVLGNDVPENTITVLKEIFKHATKVYIYDSYYESSGGSAPAVGVICAALEPYEFNVLACYTNTKTDIDKYVTQIKTWRDTYGKKVQGVIYNVSEITAPDHEGIITVVNTVSDSGADPHALVAWVAGAEAACAINATCTNMIYDGNYTVVTDLTQGELEDCIESGEFAFHLVYGDVRVLEDINSLTTTTVDKGEDFKSNQTIRVIDQLANDVARVFNRQFLGKVPNDADGRSSLWSVLVKYHQDLEDMRAIENYDSSQLTVEQGDTKKAVVINDVITVVNGMSQLYMTIVVQ